jgi:hypothetical protein
MRSPQAATRYGERGATSALSTVRSDRPSRSIDIACERIEMRMTELSLMSLVGEELTSELDILACASLDGNRCVRYPEFDRVATPRS